MSPPEEIALREVGPGQIDTVLNIIHRAFDEYRGAIDPPSSAPNETRERLLSAMETSSVVLATVDGIPAGCVFYEPRPARLYLFRLAVVPEHRRKGIARRLIEHVERRARDLGIHSVTLGTRLALPRNRAYYERLGYRVMEYRTHPGYSEPTYVIMGKDLPQ